MVSTSLLMILSIRDNNRLFTTTEAQASSHYDILTILLYQGMLYYFCPVSMVAGRGHNSPVNYSCCLLCLS